MQEAAHHQFFVNQFGDAYLHSVNRNSFNAIGADATFRKHFGEWLALPDTLYIIIGTDSGLLARWAARQRAPGSRFLFIELPDLIDIINRKIDDIIDPDHLRITTLEHWRQQAESFHLSDYAYLGHVQLLLSLGASDANIGTYRLVERELRPQIEAVRREIGLQLGNHTFIRTQLHNLGDNLIPATSLQGCATGKSAVVLAGGPSLDLLLPWVSRHRGQLILIAVSRIAGRLLDAAIEPDIVASLDPYPVSFDVSRDALRFTTHPLLVHSYHVEPHLLAQWPGPTCYFGNRFPWDTSTELHNLPVVGPTVTNLALETAIEMGCTQIVLGGVDLCFARDGHTHAKGSDEHAAGPRLAPPEQEVETNAGEMADTDTDFAFAINSMGSQVKAAIEENGCRVINPAPDAARIPYVEHIPLEDINLSGEKVHFSSLVGSRLSTFDKSYRRDILKKTQRELAESRRQILAATKLCDEALRCNDRLFRKEGNFRYKKRMDRIERRLDHELRRVTPLIKQFGIGGFLRLIRPGNNDEWSDEELRSWGDSYYENYRKAANDLEQLIAQTQQRIKYRLKELEEEPDLHELAHAWLTDDVPGRFQAFSYLRPECIVDMDDSLRHLWSKLENALATQISRPNSDHAEQTRELHSLSPVRGRLLMALEQGKIDELERLASILETLQQQEAEELALLARGYLAECLQQPETAMTCYQAIVNKAAMDLENGTTEQANPRLEDALCRMSQIALQEQDTDTALQVLDALAALSPAYEPQYAQLLRLAGRIQDAVDVYVDYLKKVPDDQAVMLRLGQLFQEAGALESARWAYDQVLAQDPTHGTALQLRASLEENQTPA